MAAGVALLGVAASVSSHEPIPLWSVGAGLVLSGFGAVAITRATSSARAIEGLVVGATAWAIGAGAARDPVLAMFGAPIAAIAVLLGEALAITGLRLIRARARALSTFRVLGAGILAICCLPLPYGLLERGATVTAPHPNRGSIDASALAFSGIGLGSSAAYVQRIMGPAPPWTAAQNLDPIAAGTAYDGPSALAYNGPPGGTFLRYRGASFAIRDGHVRWIQIDDRSAATQGGLGPGDSLSLVRRFYSTAHCAEDHVSSSTGPIAYPYCQQRLGARRWLTFFASYRQPGTPITSVWLTTSALEPT